MIDTSVLVAGLVPAHEAHHAARPAVVDAARAAVPGIVLAEAWSVLRRAFAVEPEMAQRLLAPWRRRDGVLPTPASAYVDVLERAREWHLGGNVHDALVAATCLAHDVPLITLDRGQASLGARMPGLDVRLLGD